MDGWMTNSNVTVTVLAYYVTLAESGLLIYLFIDPPIEFKVTRTYF